MRMEKELAEMLAEQYFAGKMPEELKRYLFDRYGEEPLEGELTAQFFFPEVISDIKKYIRGELDTTIRSETEKLQDQYRELMELSGRIGQEKQKLEEEIKYHMGFLRWSGLEREYENFRQEAHIEQDEYGFDFYTL